MVCTPLSISCCKALSWITPDVNVEAESRVVLGFEKQFISWEKYTDAIMNIATPEQEDIAFEWEAARDSREAWQKLIDELA